MFAAYKYKKDAFHKHVMARRPWILEVVMYFLKKLYGYWGNLEELEREERTDDMFGRVIGALAGNPSAKDFFLKYFRDLFRHYYKNWQFDEAIIVYIADYFYTTLKRLRRLKSDFFDESDEGAMDIVKPADLPYLVSLPVTPGLIGSRPWLLGDPRFIDIQDEIHERSGRPPKTGTSHKNAIIIGGWMPENYWLSDPFNELFARMEEEKQEGRKFLSDDRKYNTIRGNLSSGAQEAIGSIFEHYHDKDKDDEVNDIIYNAYSNALLMLPYKLSVNRKSEVTRNFWEQIKKGLKELDERIAVDLPPAERRAYLIDKYAKGTANAERMEEYRGNILSDPYDIRRWMLAYNNYLPFGWKKGPKRGRHEFPSHEIQRGKYHNYPYVWNTYFGDIVEISKMRRPPKTHMDYTGLSEERKKVIKKFQEIYPPFYFLFKPGVRSYLPTVSRLYWGTGIANIEHYEAMREHMLDYLLNCSESVISSILGSDEGPEYVFYQMIYSWARKNGIPFPELLVEDTDEHEVLEAAPSRAYRRYKDRK